MKEPDAESDVLRFRQNRVKANAAHLSCFPIVPLLAAMHIDSRSVFEACADSLAFFVALALGLGNCCFGGMLSGRS